MDFHILTLFPDMIDGALSHSIIGRARKDGLLNINCVNIRDFANNKHKHVDDYPYGGGAGMVMQAQPIYDAFKSLDVKPDCRVLYMSPQGKTFNQEMAQELSTADEIVFICGHYEGVDERIIEEIVTDEVSIGDFVLTGGELAAVVMIDSISRNISGVLGKDESAFDESFSDGLLEYPQYTRPPEFMGRKVPDVLLSGHHANIEKWRRQQSIIRTLKKRPDLLEKAELSKKERDFLNKYLEESDL